MSMLYLSWRNIVSKPLSSALVVLLMTLGIGMISIIMQVGEQLKAQFDRNVSGIDMVVGAKGSPLQLILASIYHIDNPTGNISLAEAEVLKRNRLVERGIPLSYGDSYRGFRIVGTTEEYPQLYGATLHAGKLWGASGEVTIGWRVAQEENLSIGDQLVSAHGLVDGGEMHDDHALTVVGILEPTGSVIDQLVLTHLESIWDIHGHEEEGAEEADKEITAMLIKFRGPMGVIRLPRMINQNTNMQTAIPAFEINKLMGMMGVGIDSLNALGLLIMVVAGVSVFISLYNAMRERRYELALMRAYGASRGQLVVLVVGEGVLLAMVGYVIGIGLARLGLVAVSSLLAQSFHYSLETNFLYQELMLGLSALTIGLVAALVPAIQAARMQISQVLADG